MPHDERPGLLAQYAMGLLSEIEAAEMEAHLTDCSDCSNELSRLSELVATLAYAAPPVEPPAALRERALNAASPQVWKQWSAPSGSDLHVVRSAEGEWQRIREGVYAKQLYVDRTRDMATMLVRMEPGARYVPHRHAAPEQCFVLEGDIRDGDDVIGAGDFQCLEKGSVHGAQWTQDGCLLLIVSSLRDELL